MFIVYFSLVISSSCKLQQKSKNALHHWNKRSIFGLNTHVQSLATVYTWAVCHLNFDQKHVPNVNLKI